MQTAAPQFHDRSSSPSYDSTRKTLGDNAGRNVLEPSSCDTNTPTTPTALMSGCVCPALLPLVLFLSVDKTRPEREKWPHMRLDGTQTPNHSTQLGNGTARHVTSRHDSTRTFPYHPADRPVYSLFFFLPSAFSAASSPPRDEPESAGANHHRFLPTKKSAVATFSFASLSRKFCLLFPSCPPTEPSPAARPAAALEPNPRWNRGYATERAPCSCELGWCAR